MKQKYIFCLLLFLSLFISLFGQKHNFKCSPLSLVQGRVSGGFEHSCSPRISVGISAYSQGASFDRLTHRQQGLDNITGNSVFFGNNPTENIAFIPEIRYYFQPKKGNMRGLYANIYSKYEYSFCNNGYISLSSYPQYIRCEGNVKLSQHSIALGGSIGYQFIIKKHFSIDTFFGGNEGLNFFKGEFDGEDLDVCMQGIKDILKPAVLKHFSSRQAFRYGEMTSYYPIFHLRTGVSLGYAF